MRKIKLAVVISILLGANYSIASSSNSDTESYIASFSIDSRVCLMKVENQELSKRIGASENPEREAAIQQCLAKAKKSLDYIKSSLKSKYKYDSLKLKAVRDWYTTWAITLSDVDVRRESADIYMERLTRANNTLEASMKF